nr:glycosyltransferase [uncultured Carboxylicivirga sp.]
MKKDIDVTRCQVPKNRSHPKNILSNIFYTRRLSNDILHITGDIHYTAILSCAPTILTIHDTKSLLRGTLVVKIYKYLLWFLIPSFFINRITVISEQTYKEVRRLLPFYNKANISIIPNPINLELFASKVDSDLRDEIEFPYALHIGAKTNKNLERTARGIAKLGLNLVIIGNLSEEQVQYLNSITNLYWQNFTNLLYSDIVWLYQNSFFVTFISTYEGFGMPVLEAQAAGVPIVTSNIAPMNKIAGSGAIYVDPLSEQSIYEGYRKCYNKEKRKELINKGRNNVKIYSLDSVVSQYINLYKSL